MSTDELMKEAGKSFDKMVEAWRDSQSAMLSAQTDIAEDFIKAFAPGSGNSGGGMFPRSATENAGADAWEAFVKTWMPNWDAANMSMTLPPGYEHSLAAMFSAFDPVTWVSHAPEQLRTVLETIAGGPKFADLMTPQAEIAEAMREGLDFQKASADFSAIIQEAWTRAFNRYAKEHSVEDLKSGKVQEALDAWLRVANEELLATQRSQEFMDAQRRLLLAMLELKKRQAAQAEAWSAAFQMPTRSEVDDLAHMVHDLRKELRSIKRELALAKARASS